MPRLASTVVIAVLLVMEGAALAQPAPDGAPVQPQATAPEEQAPTRATFISTSSEQWDVVIDDQPVCSTPCTLPLFQLQFVTLRSHELRPVLLDVGRLPPGNLIVSGKPFDNGMYVGGIIATTLGGMAAATGITLLAVGAAKDSAGMTLAGLITGGVGGLSLAGGILFMLRALPTASVGYASPHAAATQVSFVRTF